MLRKVCPTLQMKTVTDDPYEFFREGGWDFLTQEGGAGTDGEDEESSAESAFNPVSRML